MASFTTGTFPASGQSTEIPGDEMLTLSLSGFGSATVELERSHDRGASWQIVDSYTADTEVNIETVGDNFLYRLDCAWTSGTIAYALGA